MTSRYIDLKRETETAILVGVQLSATHDQQFSESLTELEELVRSAEGEVAGTVTQRRQAPDSRYFIGEGKVEEIKRLIEQTEADIVVFDDQLSPAQVRNLENQFQVKVIDRGNLILDIFAKRARTTAAKLQVELAQLEYLLPRLTGLWTHMTKHVGGIGTRGPGETQLESDRRDIKNRISRLKQRLERVDRQRATQRKQRQDLFKIALVGYTNAGKSTLFNYLTRAGVWADDRPFCTLDAVTRYLPLNSGRRIVVSDTVGFIRKIPHELIASFSSTLDEVRFADLLIHLVDISHQDCREHYERAHAVLEEIGAGRIECLVVLNKCDLVSGEQILSLDERIPPAKTFLISAKTHHGLDNLLKFLADFVDKQIRVKRHLDFGENGTKRDFDRRR